MGPSHAKSRQHEDLDEHVEVTGDKRKRRSEKKERKAEKRVRKEKERAEILDPPPPTDQIFSSEPHGEPDQPQGSAQKSGALAKEASSLKCSYCSKHGHECLVNSGTTQKSCSVCRIKKRACDLQEIENKSLAEKRVAPELSGKVQALEDKVAWLEGKLAEKDAKLEKVDRDIEQLVTRMTQRETESEPVFNTVNYLYTAFVETVEHLRAIHPQQVFPLPEDVKDRLAAKGQSRGENEGAKKKKKRQENRTLDDEVTRPARTVRKERKK